MADEYEKVSLSDPGKGKKKAGIIHNLICYIWYDIICRYNSAK